MTTFRTPEQEKHFQYLISVPSLAKDHQETAQPFVHYRAANLNSVTGFQRLGLHHVTLPPGARTSLPHAESLEEEFFFVISGHPDVWVDGWIHKLEPHMAVGFPAGTGIAHTVINNTQDNVELLVVGERTKKENLCFFPLNPEQKENCGIWWAEAPTRNLGPHRGTPGTVRDHEKAATRPAFIQDCKSIPREQSWHYAGDSETFSEYARLTNRLGLQKLGIGYEYLPPGRRSSFPHAHRQEEEFLYILSGTATIWMNGWTYEASTGQAVVFAPGSAVAHTVINNSQEPLNYLIVGEATDPQGQDLIYYPKHEFRNEQCRKERKFWMDRPNVEMGPHEGRPDLPMKDHLALRFATESDKDLILDLFQRSSQYFQKVDGGEPTENSVSLAMSDRPKKMDAHYRKEFLIIEHEFEAIGVADLHLHHPQEGFAYIGLLLLTETQFGKGLGRRSFDLIEYYLKNIHQIKTLRLGISEDNDVRAFWEKMGFQPNGKTYIWKGEHKETSVAEYDKNLDLISRLE